MEGGAWDGVVESERHDLGGIWRWLEQRSTELGVESCEGPDKWRNKRAGVVPKGGGGGLGVECAVREGSIIRQE